jgi:hypothetical protein
MVSSVRSGTADASFDELCAADAVLAARIYPFLTVEFEQSNIVSKVHPMKFEKFIGTLV